MSNSLISTSEYLVDREALLIRIDMSNYLIDYYIHRKDHAANTLPDHDEKLKELISCFAVHLTVHPSSESHAWTVHMIAKEPFSLFVTGSAGQLNESGTTHGFIVGHVLTENIRHTDVNSFHAQFTNDQGKIFRSYVRCETSEVSTMVEHFYDQSEQLPMRLSVSKTSDTAIGLAALPEYDQKWFESVNLEELAASREQVGKPMRSCTIDFICECSPEKLLPFFRSLTDEAIADLYGEDAEILISCPRCGKQFPLARSALRETIN